jgi:hypothetical protein
MEERNFLEKLVDISPGMEIWWDSSPVIFESWCKKRLNSIECMTGTIQCVSCSEV